MSSLNPTDKKTIEIARRTRKNLEYIYTQHNFGEPVYEFTQLFNSMLGMLVCLREDYYIQSSIEWAELKAMGFSVTPSLTRKSLRFSQLVSNVRNAIAHSNFEFTDHNGKIDGIHLWNVPTSVAPHARKVTQNWIWNAKFKKNELREVIYLTLNYLELRFDLTVDGDPTDPPENQ